MRIEVKDGFVTAQAENVEDVERILGLKAKTVTVKTVKHKSKSSVKCSMCAKKCTSYQGLSVHRSLSHQIRGPHYEEQQKYRQSKVPERSPAREIIG